MFDTFNLQPEIGRFEILKMFYLPRNSAKQSPMGSIWYSFHFVFREGCLTLSIYRVKFTVFKSWKCFIYEWIVGELKVSGVYIPLYSRLKEKINWTPPLVGKTSLFPPRSIKGIYSYQKAFLTITFFIIELKVKKKYLTSGSWKYLQRKFRVFILILLGAMFLSYIINQRIPFTESLSP